MLEAAEYPSKLLQLHRTAGDSVAISAAYREASGEILVLLPPYVQVDPSDIEGMVKEVKEGRLDYVASWRDPRIDSRVAAKMSHMFNWLTRRASDVNLHDINSGLRVLKREILDEVPSQTSSSRR